MHEFPSPAMVAVRLDAIRSAMVAAERRLARIDRSIAAAGFSILLGYAVAAAAFLVA